jgi:carboxyl-terminal processing protease
LNNFIKDIPPAVISLKGIKTMLRYTIIFLLLTFLNNSIVSGQSKEIRHLLDTTIALMKENAANREKVDWVKIERQAYLMAANIENGYQIGPLIRTLFQSLDDFHGAFYCGDSTYRWYRSEPENSDSIKNEWKKGVFLLAEVLKDGVGYLRVPYMSFDRKIELDKKAQSLNDSLCALLDKNVKGIVLDLRLNGGGAMFPMMLGLEQILHDGKIGSFTSEPSVAWILKDDNFYLDTTILTSITPKCRIANENIPVAVLIGPGTGSSGEFLTISLKERKNTVFIGSNTAGYITATKGFKINDAVSILLSTSYGRDRTGKVYDQAISPDIFINEPDSFNDIKSDKKVMAAIKWIKSKR